jgi:phage gpG-like protein
MAITVEVDQSDIDRLFGSMQAAIADLPLDDIGKMMLDSVHQNFFEGGRPDAWAPRKQNQSWPILIKTGDMYNSVDFETERSVEESVVTVGLLKAGYAADYYTFHEDGTSNMEARPFLLIQDEDEDMILSLIHEWAGQW